MKFVTEKIEWTDAMKSFTEDLVDRKLSKLIDTENVEVKVSKLKNNNHIKVTIAADAYRCQAMHEDYYAAVNEAVMKLKDIIVEDNRKAAKFIAGKVLNTMEELVASEITKEKLFLLPSITAEEAINRFEKTDYSFYIYKDIDKNNEVAVLYVRPDETYGVIYCK